MHLRRTALLFFAGSVAAIAFADDIYRCVGPAGQWEYRDFACGEGSGDKISVRPNVVAAIDQSAARRANDELSQRIAARKRAAEDASMRERMMRDASAEPPPIEPLAQAPDYPIVGYPYLFQPTHQFRKKHVKKATPAMQPARSMIHRSRWRR
jgi:hypothetical protein